VITRFAPSPTGYLHLGHAFSALTAWEMARAAGGSIRLRMEDIDTARCRREYERAIYEDLRWLGLDWPEPVLHQSARQPAYDQALARLGEMGLTYPCSCTRGDIRAALSAPQEGAQASGPDGPIYPGTCRARPMASMRPGDALRLNMGRAMEIAGEIGFEEVGIEPGFHIKNARYMVDDIGDIVIARRDIGTSYHLAVVVDDAFQSISHVVRGHDLFAATPIHVLLQKLLGLPSPTYHHHRLIRDENGQRLAKRHDALALRSLRAAGARPADIRAMVGL